MMNLETHSNLNKFAVVEKQVVFSTVTSANVRSLTCNGVCTGSAGVTALGGSAPYDFTVNLPGGSSSRLHEHY